MIKKFKDTNAYQQIKKTGASGKPFALVFYTDTGMFVTNENVQTLIDTEYLRYELKLKEEILSNPAVESLMSGLKARLAIQINKFLNSNYLRINTIVATIDDIDEVIQETENDIYFAGWCMN